MRLYPTTAILVLCMFAVHVSAAQTPMAQIKLENRLVDKPSMRADAAPCQPQRGAVVKRLQTQKSINGIEGLDVVRVRVINGICSGENGWIADALLQPIDTPSR
ncbi:MAG: hypothetical protein HKM02_06045 [Pseudomonadales bacterium]|nr:hypothetical protein [Pseudomonadales bacterium]